MLLSVLMPVTTLYVNPVIPPRKAARIHVVVFLRPVRPDRDWKTANALRIVRVLCANQVTKRYPMRPVAAANLNRSPVRQIVQHATAPAHVQNANPAICSAAGNAFLVRLMRHVPEQAALPANPVMKSITIPVESVPVTG